MGKTYYAGVPGMHEQFGPVVGSAVKRGVKSSFASTRKHRQEPTVGQAVTTMVVGAPVMPLWSGMMLIKEFFHMMFRTNPGTPERAQSVYNMKFAGVFFVVGILIFGALLDALI